jgi:nucleoside-diphosphate-sugar epimerase
MNILVLGSQGFIGSNLTAYCISQGHFTTGCDLVESADTSYPYHKVSILSSDFDTLFSEQLFDVCINASGSGNVSYSLSHPVSDFQANTMAVIKVLDTIRKYRPDCKYVHISSAAVYGNPTQLPIAEADAIAPLSPYGFHKWASEIICREYYQIYKLPIAIVRPFSVYGNGIKKQLLWDICQKLHQGNSISLFGTGNETRDFIHVLDLAELIHNVIEKSSFKCDIYNGASGTETSIREVADIFEMNFPGQKQILFSGEFKAGDPINWRADVSKINQLDFKPAVLLETGLKDYINWYFSNF